MGFAALVATFWLLVATVRLIVTHDCPVAQGRPPIAVPAAVPAPVSNPPPCAITEWQHRHDADTFDELAGEPDRPGPMSKNALLVGLNAVKPKVQLCYDRYQVPGLAMVNIVIAASGRVSSAAVTGKFAGTPTGSCVERAVMAARFPCSDGFATPYPFQLH